MTHVLAALAVGRVSLVYFHIHLARHHASDYGLATQAKQQQYREKSFNGTMQHSAAVFESVGLYNRVLSCLKVSMTRDHQ